MGGLAYRRYHLRHKKLKVGQSSENENPYQSIYVISVAQRDGSGRLPVQFTTKVFNRRCSTGGGVTEA
ncbi:unnamed protein product [Danaus chrysippus]|uniref:(African queen) hypothetical protein n=1 Tax=Danaus chrysippus TaxID=151541 RepID=A0A8J2QYH5_9NEOP|nr:unnamed protein product [Danaus chrysippus]